SLAAIVVVASSRPSGDRTQDWPVESLPPMATLRPALPLAVSQWRTVSAPPPRRLEVTARARVADLFQSAAQMGASGSSTRLRIFCFRSGCQSERLPESATRSILPSRENRAQW